MKSIIAKCVVSTMLLAALAAPTFAQSNINQRESNQQHRIGQGINNGSLTPRETAKLERREGRIRRSVARERARNGGTLTAAEHARAERRLNRASATIYRKKHNAATM